MTELIAGTHESDTHQKALRINLDPRWYGTVAEIGAGQEVARWFFRVGGAAGTVAKSISAYDMAVSDAVYGKVDRYVSAGRLQGMLDHEFQLNVDRLDDERGDENCFFAFADTVVARSFRGGNECHGWMGVKFQAQPHDEPSQIVMHVRMLDVEAFAQQEALGIVGVNLLYGAFFQHHEPDKLIESLLDRLTTGRIEIDMIEFRGIEFRKVDNRLMALKLVQVGLSGVAMFGPDREVLQPSEALRKKAILVERGSFRPPTCVNVDMLETAKARFERRPGRRRQAGAGADRDHHAQPARGRGHRRGPARLPRPRGTAGRLRDDRADQRLLRLLPAGRLHRRADHRADRHRHGGAEPDRPVRREEPRSAAGRDPGELRPAVQERPQALRLPDAALARRRAEDRERHQVGSELQPLYDYLAGRGSFVHLDNYRPEYLSIFSRDVLRRIAAGDDSWEDMVPPAVAELIKRRGFFGYAKADRY